MGPVALVALGLVMLAGGLVGYFYPKPPPMNFGAFLGGHPRLYVSVTCIVLGGAIALAGLLSR